MNLETYKWKNRLLLIFPQQNIIPTQSEQYKAFQATPEKIRDRDILIFTLTTEQVYLFEDKTEISREQVIKKLDLESPPPMLVLIGKDGGIKYRSRKLVDPLIIYELIDSMPMRQQEMKNKR
ncbi:DUF4174 domain-containing protein [Robertkochia aurantiaca]|uniref:DUF4174 domain-containing protein n=1 Tax=Robertkochia aurantiaca TaxID=2873700 RepID=UPI001CCA230D|nr:DUF4174 domain-containing protein [Robertkochia sp. 3YJGBD-33]